MAFLFGGGMGGSTTSDTQVPAWLENSAIENINRARDVSQIGYVPYYGADVAAFSPMQQQSMQSTGNAASAFGLAPQGFDAMAGMPQAQTYAGGVQGYSSAPMFEQAKDNLFAKAPAQYNAMADMFIDPFTGAPSSRNYTPSTAQVLQSNYARGGDVGGVVAGINNAPDYTPAADGGTGYWSGGEQTGMQTQNMNDAEFEAYVLAHGLPSDTYTTGDALRGIGGNLLDSTMIGQVYEGLTGNPLAGGSPNAIVSELDNSDAYGYTNGLLNSRSTPTLAQQTAQVDELMREIEAEALATRQERYLENLNLSAVTTPLASPVITSSGGGAYTGVGATATKNIGGRDYPDTPPAGRSGGGGGGVAHTGGVNNGTGRYFS